jgi:hypothetical protein
LAVRQPRNFQKQGAAVPHEQNKASARAAFKARYNEEDIVKGADDDEEVEVAAMVAAVRQRDQELEKDLSEQEKHTGRTRDDQGVMEFDEEDYEDGPQRGGSRKRQRHGNGSGGGYDEGRPKAAWSGLAGKAAGSGGGGNAACAVTEAGSANKEVAVVKHVPGRLANADIAPGENSAQVGIHTSTILLS